MRPTHPFGELLSQMRARKPGLTQSKLAELAGYDPAVIARMGQGQKDLTGPLARERIIRILTLQHSTVTSMLSKSQAGSNPVASAKATAQEIPERFSFSRVRRGFPKRNCSQDAVPGPTRD